MCERLECCDLFLSNIKDENFVFRYDAEFFKKDYLNLIDRIKSLGFFVLEDQFDVSKLAGFEFTKYYTEENMNSRNSFPALTSINVQEEEFNRSQLITIDKTIAESFLGRSQIKFKDVILSYTGEYRRALTNVNKERMQLGPNICRLRPNGDINPFYLSVFFNSSIGQALLDREKSLSAQPTVAMSRIRKLKIPQFSKDFQTQIEEIINRRQILKRECDVLYSQAENLLMEEIGIDIDSIDVGALQVKSFKNTFAKTGRLDAEYYQGKYDAITSFLNASSTIGSLCNLHYDNYVPSADKYYKYIELANVGSSGELSGVETICGDDLPTRARRQVKKGQVVVSSIEGSLQSCALITDEFDNALCSTGFYVIDSDIINSETLLVLFKSAPLQSLLKQRCSGTILTAVSKSEFLNTPLCNIDDKIQNKIAEKVRDSFLLRKQAKDLLSLATKSVEVAIEENEDKAMELLRSTDI